MGVGAGATWGMEFSEFVVAKSELGQLAHMLHYTGRHLVYLVMVHIQRLKVQYRKGKVSVAFEFVRVKPKVEFVVGITTVCIRTLSLQ